jgi:hypothetical protein
LCPRQPCCPDTLTECGERLRRKCPTAALSPLQISTYCRRPSPRCEPLATATRAFGSDSEIPCAQVRGPVSRWRRANNAASDMPKSFATSRTGLDQTSSYNCRRVRVSGLVFAMAVSFVVTVASEADSAHPESRRLTRDHGVVEDASQQFAAGAIRPHQPEIGVSDLAPG